MRKTRNGLLVICMVVLAGCSAPLKTPSIESRVWAPNKQWVEKYGDSERTTIFFNLAVQKYNVSVQQKQIRALTAKLEALDNEPNVPEGGALTKKENKQNDSKENDRKENDQEAGKDH